jgi:transposase
MEEDRLFKLLFPKPSRSPSRVIPLPDWNQVHTELRRKNVTLRLLWVEYRDAHPDGYEYTILVS